MNFSNRFLLPLLTASYLCSAKSSTNNLRIIPESDFRGSYQENHHTNLRHLRSSDSDKTYYYIVEDINELCITAKDENLENGSNIWFQKCEKGNAFQLWHISGDPYYNWVGQWHIKAKDNKCVQGQPKYRYGSRLRMYDCDETVEGQIFEADGDSVIHKKSGFVASHKRELSIKGARIGNYLVLVKHSWSNDFVEEDDYVFP